MDNWFAGRSSIPLSRGCGAIKCRWNQKRRSTMNDVEQCWMQELGTVHCLYGFLFFFYVTADGVNMILKFASSMNNVRSSSMKFGQPCNRLSHSSILFGCHHRFVAWNEYCVASVAAAAVRLVVSALRCHISVYTIWYARQLQFVPKGCSAWNNTFADHQAICFVSFRKHTQHTQVFVPSRLLLCSSSPIIQLKSSWNPDIWIRKSANVFIQFV